MHEWWGTFQSLKLWLTWWSFRCVTVVPSDNTVTTFPKFRVATGLLFDQIDSGFGSRDSPSNGQHQGGETLTYHPEAHGKIIVNWKEEWKNITTIVIDICRGIQDPIYKTRKALTDTFFNRIKEDWRDLGLEDMILAFGVNQSCWDARISSDMKD